MTAPQEPTRLAVSETEIAQIIETAHILADAARKTSLAYFRSPELSADNKDASGFDPVTLADRETEAVMRAILAERRPKDGVMGEEQDDTPSSSGLTWVLDPIDGTRGYISGTPTWGVLIALQDEAGPLYGIIDQPYIGERFEGGFGVSRLSGPHGNHDLGTRRTASLEEATLFTTFPEVGSAEERAGFETVRDQVKLTRYGMDCYAYALLAAGQVDLVIEAGLHCFDIAAPIAVIEAAGGVVTDWQGGLAHEGGRVLAAANHELHAAALALLAKA